LDKVIRNNLYETLLRLFRQIYNMQFWFRLHSIEILYELKIPIRKPNP